MRSYSASRKTFNILEILAKLGFLLGVILIVLGWSEAGTRNSLAMYGMPHPTILLVLFGTFALLGALLLLVLAQWGRAGVDTAEYSQQMLQVARDSLEVSRQTLTKNTQFLQSYAEKASTQDVSSDGVASFSDTPQAASAPSDSTEPTTPALTEPTNDAASYSSKADPKDGEELQIYKGKTIALEDKRYIYNGIPFDSLEGAQKYIDQFSG